MVTKVVTRGQFLLPSYFFIMSAISIALLFFLPPYIRIEPVHRPRKKIAHDHRPIANTDLDMHTFSEVGTLIKRITFMKRASDRVVGRQPGMFNHLMNMSHHPTIQLPIGSF